MNTPHQDIPARTVRSAPRILPLHAEEKQADADGI